MENKRLVIIMDPGFDQFKIIINGKTFAFPSTIVRVGEKHDGLGVVKGNFYFYPGNGEIYLFGESAVNELMSYRALDVNSNLLNDNMQLNRFESAFFKYTMEAALAYSLYLFEKSKEGKSMKFKLRMLEEYNVVFGVTLPHDVLDKYFNSIGSFLKGRHNFHFYVAGEMNDKEPFYHDLSNAKFLANSQAICAFQSLAMGENNTDNEEIFKRLPAVVVDAGFKTLGRYEISRNLDIHHAESNTDYAMYNVCERVAAIINEKLPGCDFRAYQVQKYVSEDETVNYAGQSIPVAPIFKEQLDVVSSALCEDLNTNWYRELNSSKLLIIAGGTGAAYYGKIKDYMEKHFPWINVILANGKIEEQEVDPIFAVALGMYKCVSSWLLK